MVGSSAVPRSVTSGPVEDDGGVDSVGSQVDTADQVDNIGVPGLALIVEMNKVLVV